MNERDHIINILRDALRTGDADGKAELIAQFKNADSGFIAEVVEDAITGRQSEGEGLVDYLGRHADRILAFRKKEEQREQREEIIKGAKKGF